MNGSIDKVVEERIKPLLESTMQKYLGITVKEIQADISDNLKKNPLLDFVIDPNVPFKRAKEDFKRQYLLRVLRTNYGNVSAAAEQSGLDRRSIHRLIARHKINLDSFRRVILRPAYAKEMAVTGIIEKTLENYKAVINIEKLNRMYKDANAVSREIVKELPDMAIQMAEAENEFEKRYFEKAMIVYNGKTSEIARKIGLRYETLHSKLKEHGLA